MYPKCSQQKLETSQMYYKLWYIHIMKYCSTIKTNQLLMHAANMAESFKHHAEQKKLGAKE